MALPMSHYNFNLKQAIEEVNILSLLKKAGVGKLKSPEIKAFPFLQNWPDGMISGPKQVDFTATIFLWLTSNAKNIKLKSYLVNLIESDGHCVASSLALLNSYRKYCRENQIEYAV